MNQSQKREIVATLLRAGRKDLARRFVQPVQAVTLYDDVWAGMVTFYKRTLSALTSQLRRVEGLMGKKPTIKTFPDHVAYKVGDAQVMVYYQLGQQQVELQYLSSRNTRWQGTERYRFDSSSDPDKLADALREVFEDAVSYEAV